MLINPSYLGDLPGFDPEQRPLTCECYQIYYCEEYARLGTRVVTKVAKPCAFFSRALLGHGYRELNPRLVRSWWLL